MWIKLRLEPLQEPPAWMTEEVAKLQRERPDDRFEIIPKPRTSPDEELEWRLKCLGMLSLTSFHNDINC